MIDLTDVTNGQINDLIETWIHSERNRKILKMRLIDGLTYQQISDALYSEKIILSVRQIKNIIYKAERDLFKHI